ncbi:hypothetical protein PAPYR_9009 [Paratrimastix pyriformis]|uniref:Poly(A) RNA polymerase mitochondrial-like central palm domain-containing protein n=1 Tax=Paratrimastix pyriformis TaxID=342808 RepID=A0ABQ8UF20_9EUKA|nr:hypothetical protein PAPYR_9009 [Paratrimastix pyriformis]
MYKALPKIGLYQRTCRACGVTLREGCPIEEKLAHCRNQAHLQLFVHAPQLFNGDEIVPCDIDKRFPYLCILCCCGIEASQIFEHLASDAHNAQRTLAGLPPPTKPPTPPQPPSMPRSIEAALAAMTHNPPEVPSTNTTTSVPTGAPAAGGVDEMPPEAYLTRVMAPLAKSIIADGAAINQPLHLIIAPREPDPIRPQHTPLAHTCGPAVDAVDTAIREYMAAIGSSKDGDALRQAILTAATGLYSQRGEKGDLDLFLQTRDFKAILQRGGMVPARHLHKIAHVLRTYGECPIDKIITTARVPIIKFVSPAELCRRVVADLTAQRAVASPSDTIAFPPLGASASGTHSGARAPGETPAGGPAPAGTGAHAQQPAASAVKINPNQGSPSPSPFLLAHTGGMVMLLMLVMVMMHGQVIDIDLNISSPNGVYNSRYIRILIDLDPRVKPFLFAVKEWAKQHGVCDAVNGFLSSFGFMMVGLAFLQLRPDNPAAASLFSSGANPYSQLPPPPPTSTTFSSSGSFIVSASLPALWAPVRPGVLPLLPVIPNPIDLVRGAPMPPAFQLVPQACPASLYELLLLFFYYYAFCYDYSHNHLDLCQGGVVPRSTLVEHETVLFVDPINGEHVQVRLKSKVRPTLG